VLTVGEGKTEAAFVHHLKSCSTARGKSRITVRNARGGSPESAIDYTRNILAYSGISQAYDQVLLLLDADTIAGQAHESELRKRAGRIKLFISRPCIEALFLAFLDPSRDWRNEDAGTIKKHFHGSFLKEADKVESSAYASLKILRLEELTAACRAREHAQCQWAYDYMAGLLEALFGQDWIG
jgi:hypothetical protein